VNEANFIDTALEENYAELRQILDQAFDFAAKGKGAERHGNGLPWREQPHFHIAKDVGLGFPIGQALKKLREGNNMDDVGRTRAEWLGAITYIASAIYALDQGVD
jgi:hypothetical protein